MEKTETELLYDAIFHRRSVRRYDAAPLEASFLDEVLRRCSGTKELFASQPVAFKILTPAMVGGIVTAKSPQFLAVYAQHTGEGIANAAFRLQQMDLWLSQAGIGTCWLGMPRPKPGFRGASGLPYVILLAFGRSPEPVHRDSTALFKRKPLSEITTSTSESALLEPLRLAPSSTNRQAWRAEVLPGCLRLFMKRQNTLVKKMKEETSPVDEGIALCHLWLACEHAGKFISFDRESSPSPVPPGFQYALSLRLSQ